MDFVALAGKLSIASAEWNAGLAQAQVGMSRFQVFVVGAMERVQQAATQASIAIAAAATAAAAAAAAEAKAVAAVGATFEHQMSRVKAVTEGTAEEMEKLEKAAREMGMSTAYSATQAAEALEHFGAANYGVEKSIQALGPALELAAAGDIAIADAAKIAIKVMNGMSIEVDGLGHVVDVLAKASLVSTANVTEFGEAFRFLGQMSYRSGQTLESTAAAIGLVIDAGAQGGEAGSSLRNAWLSMVNPSKEAAGMMAMLDISIADAAGNIRPLPDIIDQFNAALGQMTQAERQNAMGTIFASRQITSFMTLLESGGDKLRAYEQQYKDSAGTGARVAKAMLDDLKGDIENLSGAIEETRIELFERLGPALRQTVQRKTDWLNANRELIVQKIDQFVHAVAAAFERTRDAVQRLVVEMQPAVSWFGALREQAVSVWQSLGQWFNALPQWSRDVLTLSGALGGMSIYLGGLASLTPGLGPLLGIFSSLAGKVALAGGAVVAVSSAFDFLGVHLLDLQPKIDALRTWYEENGQVAIYNFTARVERLSASLRDYLAPAMERVRDVAVQAWQAMSQWFNEMPAWQQNLLLVAGGLTAVSAFVGPMTLLGAAGKSTAFAYGLLAAAAAQVASWTTALIGESTLAATALWGTEEASRNAAMQGGFLAKAMRLVSVAAAGIGISSSALLGWIAGITAAVAALGAAMVYAWQKSDFVAEFVTGAFNRMREAMTEFASGIMVRLREFWDEHGAAVKRLVMNIGELLLSIVGLTYVIAEKWLTMMDGPLLFALDRVGNALGGIASAIDMIVSLLRGDWNSAWAAGLELMADVQELMMGWVAWIPGIGDAFTRMVDGLRAKAKSLRGEKEGAGPGGAPAPGSADDPNRGWFDWMKGGNGSGFLQGLSDRMNGMFSWTPGPDGAPAFSGAGFMGASAGRSHDYSADPWEAGWATNGAPRRDLEPNAYGQVAAGGSTSGTASPSASGAPSALPPGAGSFAALPAPPEVPTSTSNLVPYFQQMSEYLRQIVQLLGGPGGKMVTDIHARKLPGAGGVLSERVGIPNSTGVADDGGMYSFTSTRKGQKAKRYYDANGNEIADPQLHAMQNQMLGALGQATGNDMQKIVFTAASKMQATVRKAGGTREQQAELMRLRKAALDAYNSIGRAQGLQKEEAIKYAAEMQKEFNDAYGNIQTGSKDTWAEVQKLKAEKEALESGEAPSIGASPGGGRGPSMIGGMMGGLMAIGQAMSNAMMGALQTSGFADAQAAFGDYFQSITNPLEKIDLALQSVAARIGMSQINRGDTRGLEFERTNLLRERQKIVGNQNAEREQIAQRSRDEYAKQQAQRREDRIEEARANAAELGKYIFNGKQQGITVEIKGDMGDFIKVQEKALRKRGQIRNGRGGIRFD